MSATNDHSLTVPQGAALAIGAVLGTGVITLPAIAADIAGPASLVAWAALVLLSIPLAATFAALGSRHPDRGGVSTYARRAFGDRTAGVVGWCFFFAVPMGAPPAAMMAAGYVADVTGGGRATMLAVAVALIGGTGLMNLLGLRLSGRVQLGLTSALAAVMVITILVASPHAQTASLTPFAPHGLGAVASAAAVLVWGFAGWEAVASLAGDYRNPARDVPRATAVAVAVVGVLYLALAGATILVLGPRAGQSAAPLSDLLALGLGDLARAVMATVAVLLTIGAMNAYYAGGSRLGAALARDGALPAWLAKGSDAGQVPRRSVTLIAGMGLFALAVTTALDLDLAPMMLLATGCFTLVYVIGTASAIRLLPRKTFSWYAACFAFACTLALLVVAGTHTLWALGIAAASLVYQEIRRRRGASVLAVTTPVVGDEGTDPVEDVDASRGDERLGTDVPCVQP